MDDGSDESPTYTPLSPLDIVTHHISLSVTVNILHVGMSLDEAQGQH